jgi:hypothetical protein
MAKQMIREIIRSDSNIPYASWAEEVVAAAATSSKNTAVKLLKSYHQQDGGYELRKQSTPLDMVS